MNPLDMIKMFMNRGETPKELLMKSITENNSNPMINNLIKMAEEGDNKGVENFARNLFQEQRIDFDKEYAEFKKNFR